MRETWWRCVRCHRYTRAAEAAWLVLTMQCEGTTASLALCPACQRWGGWTGATWVATVTATVEWALRGPAVDDA